MYATSTPRPASWRPGRLMRLGLGLFPGVRVMAMSNALAGLPYLVLGIAATVLGGLLYLEWQIAADNVRTYHIREVYLLLHAGAVVLAALTFEMLRFGSALEEKYYGSRAPRLLAALLLPSLLVLFGGPALVRLWPQLMEALWLTALVIVLGGIPAAIWSAAEGFLMSSERLRRFQIAVGVGLLLAVGSSIALVFAMHSLRGSIAADAADAGFVLLPRLLAG